MSGSSRKSHRKPGWSPALHGSDEHGQKPRGARAVPRGAARRRRRIVLASVTVVVLGALGTWMWRSGPPQADLRRVDHQNVLLITIDTLRADALGSYGGAVRTPALDRLAAEGVRFDFAHAHAVMTLPSHASILTGSYPFQHGIRDNSGFRLPPGTATLASLLKQAGYRTGAFVGSFTLDSRFGLNAGFDVYDDRVGDARGVTDFTMPERPASAVVPLARRWVGEPGGPWFAWVHVFDPHAPYRPPAPFNAEYAGRPYYGEVAAVDAALAPLLEDVRRGEKRTIVVVTGDHGEGLGEHGEEAHGVFAYESTLRIPLIIAEMGGGPSSAAVSGTGEVSAVAARHVDIVPTLLDAVGAPTPPTLAGRSLLPREERRAGAQPRPTYFEAMSGMLNHGWAPLTGVIADRDKFIELPLAERYNLAADAREVSNIFGRLPERDRALNASLGAFGSTLPGRRVTEDAEAAARLRALGYVSGSSSPKAKYAEADDPKRLVELDAAVHRAVNDFGEGRADAAARELRAVMAKRPDMAVAYRYLAQIEWQQGRATDATATLRLALAHGLTDARIAVQLAEYLMESGKTAEAIQLLEPLAVQADADAETLNVAGMALGRAGRLADAKRAFERLAALLPRSSAPDENIGVLELQRNDAAAAKAAFARAVTANPASSRAHGGLGAAAYQAGDKQTAYGEWAKAVQLDGANFDALFSLGLNLANDGRSAEARPYLEQFRKAAPPSAYAAQLKIVETLLK